MVSIWHRALAIAVSATAGLTPAGAWAQREPVVLLCKPITGETADVERFLVELDFDNKVLRFHRRELPPMKMLMVQSWRVEFANDEKSPTLLGTINRITGDITIERVGASGEQGPREATRATCERTAPVF